MPTVPANNGMVCPLDWPSGQAEICRLLAGASPVAVAARRPCIPTRGMWLKTLKSCRKKVVGEPYEG